jgi:hypothetical protein
MNWVRMEDMKADVEPFPFVPAMCIALRALKLDGCRQCSQFEKREIQIPERARSYLIANLLAPFYHFRNSLLVHFPSRLSNSIDDGEVRLQCVERRNSVLSQCQSISFGDFTVRWVNIPRMYGTCLYVRKRRCGRGCASERNWLSIVVACTLLKSGRGTLQITRAKVRWWLVMGKSRKDIID